MYQFRIFLEISAHHLVPMLLERLPRHEGLARSYRLAKVAATGKTSADVKQSCAGVKRDLGRIEACLKGVLGSLVTHARKPSRRWWPAEDREIRSSQRVQECEDMVPALERLSSPQCGLVPVALFRPEHETPK
jgi:hypothetical protein